ncbi:helix-hairpin-helix domain-containing protein [Salinigranum salinum]|uniref:helix-hairpin-helix domain-containing protein n=1 Tax=Salinigranum salinum TaxID=1364937 RepID=UPI0012606F1C|nr:helix-hairpin-helix domain-containing protein [Salinigranum salinum]
MSGRDPRRRRTAETIGDLHGIGDARERALREVGVESLDDVRTADIETLTAVEGISRSMAHRMREEAGAVTPTERTRAASTATPEEWRVTDTAARFLSDRTGLAREELREGVGLDLSERLRNFLDPSHLQFRRLCGRVVKRDSSGTLRPVPNATVTVEDTDCSFLGHFPDPYPWGWLFPFNCHRETVAEVKTDECGRFCVFVPRWDIDRVLRFRRERVCLDDLFVPRIRDLFERLPHVPDPIPDPPIGPGPDPFRNPFEAQRALRAIGGIVEPLPIARLEEAVTATRFAESTAEVDEVLDAPAFPRTAVKPPLPPEIVEGGFEEIDEVTELLMERVEVPSRHLEELAFTRYLGPIFPCREIVVPEWTTFLDVPDITFRVTQDVDGDGDEEVIYDEGFFEVRWDADDLSDVTLEADGNAIAVDGCGLPPIPEEDCETPEFLVVGRMPLEPDYHDATSGYALRVNRPRPNGLPDGSQAPEGEAPYARTLQLSGCVRTEENARYYRVRYAYEGDDPVSFANVSWTAAVMGGGTPIRVQPVDGEWYDIDVLDTLVDRNWLFNWNTRRYDDGRYTLYLDVADADMNVLETSAPMSFVIDNKGPTVALGLIEWAEGGDSPPPHPSGAWTTIVEPGAAATTCPKIPRSGEQNVWIRVSYTASAAHLRDVSLGATGCSSSAQPARDSAADPLDYGVWHRYPAENTYGATGHFVVEPSDTSGSYSVVLSARTRAFSPAGASGPAADWYINSAPIGVRVPEGICVIDSSSEDES